MINGKKATKKEKAMADARVAIAPSTILLQKNKATSYTGTPSKNGREIFFARSAIFSPIFIKWLMYLPLLIIRFIVLQFSVDEYSLSHHFFSTESKP